MVAYGVTWLGWGESGVPCSQQLLALWQLVFVLDVDFLKYGLRVVMHVSYGGTYMQCLVMRGRGSMDGQAS